MRKLSNAEFSGEFYLKFSGEFASVEGQLLIERLQTAEGLDLECSLLCFAQHGLYVICVPVSFYCLQAGSVSEKVANAEMVSRAVAAIGEMLMCREPEMKQVYVYEDVFRRDAAAVLRRLGMLLGQGRRVFARNCVARRLDPNVGRSFLNAHHAYGAAHARFYYGLFLKRKGREMDSEMMAMMPVDLLLGVASFSAPRKMKYEDGRLSCEWIRYSALSGMRIVGGMSMLLKFFFEEQHPDEVMTYADREWSQGDAYRKMGFSEVSFREPVPFLVDPVTYERTHLSKVDSEDLPDDCLILSNLGSLKLILRK